MPLASQRCWLARKVEVRAVLSANGAKLKQGKFGQLSNSATKAGAGEFAGMKRRHEEKDLCPGLD